MLFLALATLRQIPKHRLFCSLSRTYSQKTSIHQCSYFWQLLPAFNHWPNTGGGMPCLQRMSTDSQIGIHYTDEQDTRIKVDVVSIEVPRIATAGRTGGNQGNGGIVTITATGPSKASYLTTGTQTWSSQVNSVFQIGGRQQQSSSTSWFNGLICECVAMQRDATTLERQKVEGYFAHKWGLAASLPADHPYRNVAPTV